MSRAFPLASRAWLLILSALCLCGCAGVKVNAIKNDDYLALRRGDVLTTGDLSASARIALQVVGIAEKDCRKDLPQCRQRLAENGGLADENRLSALAELWLLEAMRSVAPQEARVDAYLESARHAYAYLFFTARSTGSRALEDRQTQVRDYYNFAVQEAMTQLFELHRGKPPQRDGADGRFHLQLARWSVTGSLEEVRLAEGRQLPRELIPAASLSFAGLRNQYRRDGLGAELVAVTRKRVVSSKSDRLPWSETPFPAISIVIRFPGDTLEDVLATRTADITGYDPYRTTHFQVADQSVPLAANFTSGYGLWLARSGFARQSLLTLVGRGEVLEAPHLYLLQPYDPERHIVIMLHGLASSPEAWINVANEMLGDEVLRNNYQIWQIYYPTNLPIAFNNRLIRDTIERTLAHFDPQGTAVASRDIVLVGHSMGGVLSRLLVSSTEDRLWSSVMAQYPMSGRRLEKARASLGPYLHFEPLPQVSRAVFVAAPHRGTPFAENRLSRWASGLVKLPVSVLGRFREFAQVLVDPNSAAPVVLDRGFNSIDNLSDQDPFVRAAAELPIPPRVRYHSIIGNHTPALELAISSDGVVPYGSAHLPGAQSEKIIPSWHSVQETPEAIIEIRRILNQHLVEQREP
ncbi:alpha/beta hydrolase [Stutzerimonas nosocomialis]|uniref:Alpha/beta hydrolase n=2 Tax=Stutzerimonas nosocomialis TaxID=1056496 RepID=A0A5R9QGZ7_9GAMM|nr:alpha/beta hydrolase [Stutzerimonas nosocomialis]